MEDSIYTPKCIEFLEHFKGKSGVTTHQIDNEEAFFFSGTVYINHYEFVCLAQLEENKYMVYINNPEGHDSEQWIFGYYKSFKRALKKTEEITEKRVYPKPIEIW